MIAGGVGTALTEVLHRDWGKRWRLQLEAEATLHGLYRLAEMAR